MFLDKRWSCSPLAPAADEDVVIGVLADLLVLVDEVAAGGVAVSVELHLTPLLSCRTVRESGERRGRARERVVEGEGEVLERWEGSYGWGRSWEGNGPV